MTACANTGFISRSANYDEEEAFPRHAVISEPLRDGTCLPLRPHAGCRLPWRGSDNVERSMPWSKIYFCLQALVWRRLFA